MESMMKIINAFAALTAVMQKVTKQTTESILITVDGGTASEMTMLLWLKRSPPLFIV